jgi:hypothetical protein
MFSILVMLGVPPISTGISSISFDSLDCCLVRPLPPRPGRLVPYPPPNVGYSLTLRLMFPLRWILWARSVAGVVPVLEIRSHFVEFASCLVFW